MPWLLWLPAQAAAQPAAGETTTDAKISVAPLPVIFYTPETKTAIGALLNIFYRPAGSPPDARPSTLMPAFVYTFENQVIVFLEVDHYWDRERNFLSAEFSYFDFPDSFYPIGNRNHVDDTEDYTTKTYGVSLDYNREVRPSLRLGGGVAYGHAAVTRTEPGGRLAAGGIAGAEGGDIFGFGLFASRDSRDDITYPSAGGEYELKAHVFDGALGSDFDYRTVSLDARTYRAMGGAGVVAFRAVADYTDGVAPFQVLPSLGGDSLLRGYFGGRFRDRQLAALQLELRSPLWKRFGVVGFAGLGQVAGRPQDFQLDAFHGAGGVGLRFLLIRDEGLNLRLDQGWGNDDSGTYVGLGEAF